MPQGEGWQIQNRVLKDSGMDEGEHEAHEVKVGGVDEVEGLLRRRSLLDANAMPGIKRMCEV